MKRENNFGDCATTEIVVDPSATFPGPSTRQLSGPVPQHFEAFYRTSLRYCRGSRLRSLVVGQLYEGWASAGGAPSMNMRQVKRAMVSIGHRHLKSNGMHFEDVQLASSAPSIPDNFPSGAAPPPAERGIVGRIDRICIELEQLRREVQAAR